MRLGNCLADKVLSSRTINREAFRAGMARLWGNDQVVVIESIGPNRFVFTFLNANYKRRVIVDGPWHFNKSLIVFEELGLGELRSLKFDRAKFWIQVHNVPIVCMNERMGLQMGKMIGEVLELDRGPTRSCLGKFLRIRLRIDVSKLLHKAVNVVVKKDEPHVTLFLSYRRLPNFCMNYGRLNHVVHERSLLPLGTHSPNKMEIQIMDTCPKSRQASTQISLKSKEV